ncbi:hypothetical protein [Stenotrophomonas maltophilia]|uniref:hypothetical protein n=1 Tax=Stenotrophomonas maltophilia TaxID=40324 RepID=UPI0010700CF3|nr:hypothetical protein [Stenotrophomonas maltophilia]
MSILNVLLRSDQLLVAVDTLAEDARTGVTSAGAKALLIPQHNLVLATRGSTQFFIRVFELTLQASYRSDFRLEQLFAEMGAVIDRLWPSYEEAAAAAGLPIGQLGSEILVGGWSPQHSRMMATAYAKSSNDRSAIVQPLDGGLASPGEPLVGRPDSFDPADVLASGKIQAAWLNGQVGRKVAGGRLLATVLRENQAVIQDLGQI